MVKASRPAAAPNHAAMLEFIRTEGPKAPENATIKHGDQITPLADFVRSRWKEAKESPAVASQMVQAIEHHAQVKFNSGG
jgi:hypothetical protein